MNSQTLIDLRHLDAKPREPEFQPADPEDIKKAEAFKQNLRIERMAEGYRLERERDGRPL